MKTYVLFTLCSLLSTATAAAEIINGYEKDIHSARTSLRHLVHMPTHQKVRYQINRIRRFIYCYETTEKMLVQFRLIAPEIYDQIDTIRDSKGRRVNVYVRFSLRSELPANTVASTSVGQLSEDHHAHYSNYGVHTISAKIAIGRNSLLILAHEFGHIAYQVSNLASYLKFYSNRYTDPTTATGHNPGDPSGHSAARYEKKFQRKVLEYKHALKDKGKMRDWFSIKEVYVSQIGNRRTNY